MAPKWKLLIGWHRGSLISRDTEVREHDSLEDCQKDVADYEKFLKGIGYHVWYAWAEGPDGENIDLHPGTPCVPTR